MVCEDGQFKGSLTPQREVSMKGMSEGYGNKKMYGGHTKATMGKKGTGMVTIKSPLTASMGKAAKK